MAKITSTREKSNKVVETGCLYFADHDGAEHDAANVATADDADDDDDAGFSLKCENTTGRDSVRGTGDVPTVRPKDGGRDTESQRGKMTSTTMTTTNKKVMLGAVGTVDKLGSVVRGSEDGGSEESVHGLALCPLRTVRRQQRVRHK